MTATLTPRLHALLSKMHEAPQDGEGPLVFSPGQQLKVDADAAQTALMELAKKAASGAVLTPLEAMGARALEVLSASRSKPFPLAAQPIRTRHTGIIEATYSTDTSDDKFFKGIVITLFNDLAETCVLHSARLFERPPAVTGDTGTLRNLTSKFLIEFSIIRPARIPLDAALSRAHAQVAHRTQPLPPVRRPITAIENVSVEPT